MLSFGFERREFAFAGGAQRRKRAQGRRRLLGLARLWLNFRLGAKEGRLRRLLGEGPLAPPLGFRLGLSAPEPAFRRRRQRLLGFRFGFQFGFQFGFRRDREDSGLFCRSRRGPLWFRQRLKV